MTSRINHGSITIYLANFFACLMLLQAEEKVLPIAKEKATFESGREWYDCKLFHLEGKAWEKTESYYDRLPAKAKETVRPPVWSLGKHTSGMIYCIKTNSKSLSVRWKLTSSRVAMHHMPATGVSGVDVYGKMKDGQWKYLRSKIRPVAGENTVEGIYIGRSEQVLLYLPLYNGVSKIEIGLDPGSTASRVDRKLKKVVFYGSSITQGACVSRPGMSYPAMVGRDLGIEIINLGFSGNGKMEPEVATLLSELKPDLFVLDCLWNISAEEAKVRYEPFVRKLIAAQPNIPILLAEDCNVNELSPTPKGEVAKGVIDKLRKEKIGQLHYLPNTGMQGKDGDATVDGTHPNDLGMRRMADVFGPKIKAILKLH